MAAVTFDYICSPKLLNKLFLDDTAIKQSAGDNMSCIISLLSNSSPSPQCVATVLAPSLQVFCSSVNTDRALTRPNTVLFLSSDP